MQAFMLWMSGNSVQIFSVAITAMLMFSPIKALMSMSQGKPSHFHSSYLVIWKQNNARSRSDKSVVTRLTRKFLLRLNI